MHSNAERWNEIIFLSIPSLSFLCGEVFWLTCFDRLAQKMYKCRFSTCKNDDFDYLGQQWFLLDLFFYASRFAVGYHSYQPLLT